MTGALFPKPPEISQTRRRTTAGAEGTSLPVLLDGLRVPRRGSAGGRPVGYDTKTCKRRNVVERAINRLKNWRALATRHDELAVVYRGGLLLAAAIAWLRT
ncbi:MULTISPECIES: hypothetical protein [unclassified Modestobacter]